jgi:CubicO group peptidase (beta-lactamase class C family)
MKSEKISEFLQSRIDAKDFPSAVYLVAEKGEIVFQDALGFAVVEPEKITANVDTIYDLASLTKPLVTGLLCAKLIEKGVLKLGETAFEIRDYSSPDRSVIIQDLLTHTTDSKAWKPLYLIVDNSGERSIFGVVCEDIDKKAQSKKVIYSDLNFIYLKIYLENLLGEQFDKIAEREIFEPLNLINTFYNPPKKSKKRIAASELGNEYEKRTCIEQGFDVSKYEWRDYRIWGEVHDGNAYFMNGVSGHAGLFSTAEETFKIAQQFLAEETTLLKPETCKLFRTNFTPNLNEARSIAFQLAETKDSTASEFLAKDSFGHLGFTGTSLWIEPETERIFILLTNRTHARKLPFANINSVRRKFHEFAVQILDG